MMTESHCCLARIRHDMNNLLSKILGAAELALLENPVADVRDELRTIVRLVEEGAAMVACFEDTRETA